MSFSDSRANVAAGIAIAALLTLCWMIYSPALGGTFLFDDWHNLSGLSKISDFNTALQYVLSRTAGPSGRPLALATFAFQAGQWGGSANPFLQVNILIHLLNGLLVYLFFLQLAHTQRVSSVDAQLVAITAVAFWLFMPLLASSTLMVVQRMATLSACFMLVGLNCYLWFRTRIDLNPHTALFAMGLTIAFATSLAILAKENGALLPSLILVLELTLLRRPAGIDLGKWRSWQLAFLLLPTLAIATFLILQTPYSRAMVLQKDFAAWERLLTEAQILWQYLFHAAVAKPFELGPFHDDYLISRSILEPLTFLATAAWVAVLAAAIKWRRRYPIAAFAALWFVTGHLLESTTVPLYLYFEHRNYLPVIGPIFAASFMLVLRTGAYRKIALGSLSLYFVVTVGLLYSVTSLWGNPQMAAGYWHLNSPRSADAVGHLANRQLSSMGPQVSMLTLNEFSDQYPAHAYLRLPALVLSCANKPTRPHGDAVESLKNSLSRISFAPEVGPMLDDLLNAVHDKECNGVPPGAVKDMTLSVFRNPRYSSNTRYSSWHHQLLAKLARNSGDTDEAVRQLTLARSIRPSDDLNLMIVSLLIGDRQFDEARQFLQEVNNDLSFNPIKRVSGKIKLKELRQYVNLVENPH